MRTLPWQLRWQNCSHGSLIQEIQFRERPDKHCSVCWLGSLRSGNKADVGWGTGSGATKHMKPLLTRSISFWLCFLHEVRQWELVWAQNKSSTKFPAAEFMPQRRYSPFRAVFLANIWSGTFPGSWCISHRCELCEIRRINELPVRICCRRCNILHCPEAFWTYIGKAWRRLEWEGKGQRRRDNVRSNKWKGQSKARKRKK